MEYIAFVKNIQMSIDLMELDNSKPMKQIGRELNVRYVLEGSVQRGGNRMRVKVQLIEDAARVHLWAERFEKPIADLLEMQDETVSRLANRLGQECRVSRQVDVASYH